MTEAKGAEPAAIDLLAPWAAVDRLDADDARALERLLADEPDLARRLAFAREERDAAVALNEALPTASASARERLFARIEAQDSGRAPIALGRFHRWLSERLAALSPGTLALGATAAALVIAVQVGVIATLEGGPEAGGYRPASHGGEAAPGQRALVGFAPGATLEDIARLMSEAGAEIVGGPKPGGVFIVRIADRPLDKPELDAALKRLQRGGSPVRFAVPEQAMPPQ